MQGSVARVGGTKQEESVPNKVEEEFKPNSDSMEDDVQKSFYSKNTNKASKLRRSNKKHSLDMEIKSVNKRVRSKSSTSDDISSMDPASSPLKSTNSREPASSPSKSTNSRNPASSPLKTTNSGEPAHSP